MKLWQKMITMLMLAFVLVVIADGFKVVSKAESGKTNNTVNMRKTPSKNGDLVKKLEKGTSVEIVSQVDGKDGDGKKWYEVTVGGTSGYIRSDLVDKVNNSNTNTGTKVGEVESVTPVGATITGSNTVRVRTSADTSTGNNILTTANKGTSVTVIGKTTGADGKTWYQVKLNVDGNDVVGYVRSDYLAINGEVKPLDADTPVDDPVESTEPVDPVDDPVEYVPSNTDDRYEAKLITTTEDGPVWYLLDRDKEMQYKIEKLFEAADSSEANKAALDKANKKANSRKGWMIFFLLTTLALGGAVAYLIYLLRETKEEMYISDIEKNTPRRTAERPRAEVRGNAQAGGRERPAIKDGLEARGKEDGQRPANGQRTTGNRQQPGQAQRPAQGQQGQRPAQGQRPVQGQQGQRPMQGQQGQPVQGQQGQRPMQGQPTQGQRPMQGQPVQGQRPMQGQPVQGQRPVAPQQPVAARPKNFVQDADDAEFEFLNWDSDE